MSKSEYSEEEAYLQLIRDIRTKGEDDEGRNGRVRCIFGANMRFSMNNNKIFAIDYVEF